MMTGRDKEPATSGRISAMMASIFPRVREQVSVLHSSWLRRARRSTQRATSSHCSHYLELDIHFILILCCSLKIEEPNHQRLFLRVFFFFSFLFFSSCDKVCGIGGFSESICFSDQTGVFGKERMDKAGCFELASMHWHGMAWMDGIRILLFIFAHCTNLP